MFKEKGYEVHVATNGTEEIPYCDVKHVISFERSPIKINNLKAIKDLKKIIDKEKFDIIHCHTPMGSVVTRIAAKKARKKGTRVIYTAHGFHFFKGAPITNWLMFYPVEKYLSKYTDCLITINQEDYKLAKKKFKKCKQIELVHGVGVDESKFNFKLSDEEKHKLRESLGLKDDDFVLIQVGELNKNKNQIMAIKAMEKLVKENSKIHLLIVGKGKLENYYKGKIQEYNLEQNIHMLGYRNDIPKLMKISDVLLSLSYREGLPVNVIEGMIGGLPIIATDRRGQRNLVKDKINGFIVNVNNYKKLAECIEKIYLSETHYEKFGIESRKIINQYLLKNIIDELSKIYFKKKTILHLLSSNSFSGAENVACTIIDLIKDDYNAFYCSPDGEIANTLKNRNIVFLPIKKMRLKDIKKVVLNNQIDIIHAHDFKASLYASMLYKNCFVLSHLHKNDPKMNKLSIKSILYLIESKRFDKIIGVSDSIIDEYIFNYKIKDKYVTLQNFVNKELVTTMANEYQVKKKYDIFFFGRLSEEKNPLEFIRIVHLLNNKKIRCVMIGDGPLKEKCNELINFYSLNDNIHMIGFKSNPFPYIKASKIGIMPSKFEGFGLTAVEAMILNKPVLNSGVGGLKTIFKNNDYLICNNIEQYISKIDYLLSNVKKYDYYDIIDDNTFRKKIYEIYS